MSRHAVVVGASSGIGAAVASALTKDGWEVSAFARRTGTASAKRWISCDVVSDASVEHALAQARAEGGQVDALVYSAGSPVMGTTLATPEDAARASFEVNFWGLERVVRRVLPSMMNEGSGSIVAVLSIAAVRAVPFEAYYGAAKAAAARWLDCVALEAEGKGVRVRYLAPGYVPTGFLERGGWHGMEAPRVASSGVGPDDVARAVLDLVSGRRARAVFGWRENAIAYADRIAPGAYDRVLRGRVRKSRPT